LIGFNTKSSHGLGLTFIASSAVDEHTVPGLLPLPHTGCAESSPPGTRSSHESRSSTGPTFVDRNPPALIADEPVPDRRSAAAPRSATLVCANLELHPDEYQVLVGGRRLGLTVREFEVLLVLAHHKDRVVRRAHIYERVWGGEMKYRERAVDVFVRKVRNKLTQAAPGWLYIHTHFGVGYRLTPEQLDPRVELS
jgi:DNA-binding winged helix-turn-helix (wHTH) protein